MITKKEYELLKYYLATGYGWIARDKNKELCVYEIKPTKLTCSWLNLHIHERFDSVCDDDHLFQYIKWDDEEPTKIDELIKDYESYQAIISEKVKVTIPQYVADWIEKMKIMHTLKGLFSSNDMPKKVQDWLYCNNKNCEKMALAWIFGYEVEKEKLYTVRLANGDCLYRIPSKGMAWVLTLSDYKNDKNYQLTQSEIESIDPVLMLIAEEVE